MEIVTARHLQRAYIIAENAARGRFPCLEPLLEDPARPVFDYPQIGQQLREYIVWGKQYAAEIRARREREKREWSKARRAAQRAQT